MNDFAQKTAAELIAGYASKHFSPLEVAAELLGLVHRHNPVLNALYIIDEEAALASARASSERWAKGAPLSALDGVPTTIKDALLSKGHASYRGSAAHMADRQTFVTDAPVVARMREAGMVFLGKTTMPDFGILASGYSSKHGITRNPWSVDHTTGGSSSGAAAAIAAGMNPIAVGTDIVGSIRLPASFTGIFGFKPSQGRVPYYFPNSPSLVAGPMARTVEDAALLMNVIAQPDARDFTALAYDQVDYLEVTKGDLGTLKIGYIDELGFGVVPDPEVRGVVDNATQVLAAKGHSIIRKSQSFSLDEMREAERFYKVRCWTELSSMPTERQADAAVIAEWSAEAKTMSAADFYGAFMQLQRMREKAMRLIDDCDLLILPTVPRVAFQAELPGFSAHDLFSPWINTFLFNLTEQPASSVPCGHSAAGLPIGLQIVGPRFSDQRVFAFSAMFERLMPIDEALQSTLRRWTTA